MISRFQTTLGECCEIVSGATPATGTPEYWDGDIEWATPKDLGNLDGKSIARTNRRITTEGLTSCAATVLPPQSVLFSSRAPIGHVAINLVPMATNQGFKSFVPRADILDSSFLYYWLRAHRQVLESLGNGATFKEVSKAVVSRVEICLPSLATQRRVAAILDKADAIRRKRIEALALTDELVRSVFLEMFGDPVTNPKKWGSKPLSELATITTGNTPPREVSAYFGDSIEWIKSDNINTPSHFLTHAAEGLSKEGRAIGRTVPAGSTLMTCIAGSPSCIGNVALADREVAFNQQINALTPCDDVDFRFLYTLLMVGKALVQAASTNSMKGMVSKGRLEAVLVPSPPRKLQAEFGKSFDKIMKLRRKMESAAQHAELCFDSSLHQAFSVRLYA